MGASKMNAKIESLDWDDVGFSGLNEWDTFSSWIKDWVDYHQVAEALRLARMLLSNLQVIIQLFLLVMASSSDDKNRSECTIEAYNFLSRHHQSFSSPCRSLWVIFVTFDLLFIENNCLFWLAPSCSFGPFTKASDLETPGWGWGLNWIQVHHVWAIACAFFFPWVPSFKLLTSPLVSK